MSRWVAVVVVLLLAGCSSGGDDSRGGAGSNPASTTTSTPPPGAFVDLSDLEREGIEATRVTPTLDGRPFDVSTRFDLVGVGGVLVVAFVTDDPALTGVASSTDGGETWTSVRFPETEHRWRDPLVHRMGDAVVVTADDVRPRSDRVFIWTTTDGVAWRGGEVTVSPEVSGLTVAGGQLPDGTLMLPVLTADQDHDRALTSSDGGASWQEGECPAVALAEESGCMGLTSAGRGLWLALHEVSLDEGQTWQQFHVDPDPERSGDQQLRAVAALADSGWLGVVTDVVVRNGDLVDVRYLARSRDGIVWEPVLTDLCTDAPDTVTGGISEPAAFGDGWLVSHDCERREVSVRSELQLLDGTGAHPRLVARMDAGDAEHPHGVRSPHVVRFGAPVAAGDAVIVPELDNWSPHPLRILQLQPAS